MKQLTPELFYADDGHPFIVRPRDVDILKAAADASPTHSARLCTHPSSRDLLHEMIIVHTPQSYIPPHRQTAGKSESLCLLEGELHVAFFEEDDDLGNITQVVELRRTPQRPLYYRVNAPVWHAMQAITPYAVFLEITNGPFQTGDTEYAPWWRGDWEALRAQMSAWVDDYAGGWTAEEVL